MADISFYEQYEWSASKKAMKFWAVQDGNPIICWASEAFLHSVAEEDAEEAPNAQAIFMQQQAYIQELARIMVRNKHFSDDGSVVINRDISDGASVESEIEWSAISAER